VLGWSKEYHKAVGDFEALNHARSQTLRQIREMVSEEAALWARYFNGQDTAQLVAEIEANRTRFRALWEQHERVRQAMADAGFMPPPAQSEDSAVEDPVRRKFEERLRSEVESARAEYYSASQEFRYFAAQGTGLPAPDGNLRAKQIAAFHSAALHKYTSAIRRFNTFLTDGKPPEE
jgi:hypothetical protein